MSMCRSRNQVLSFCLFLITKNVVAQSAACDDALIKALATTYHLQANNSLSQSVQDVVCNNKKTDFGVGYDKLNLNLGDTSNACAQHNAQYFEEHKDDLAISFLPPEAYDTIKVICSATNLIELKATETGNAIDVFARFKPMGNVTEATINHFTYSTGSAKCMIVNLKSQHLLKNGGVGDTCVRKTDDPVLFTLLTSQGYQVYRLPARNNRSYKLALIYANDLLKCSLNDQLVGQVSEGHSVILDITDRIKHGQQNIINCVAYDLAPNSAGQSDWSYLYKVYDGEKLIFSAQDQATGQGMRQPPPFTFNAP